MFKLTEFCVTIRIAFNTFIIILFTKEITDPYNEDLLGWLLPYTMTERQTPMDNVAKPLYQNDVPDEQICNDYSQHCKPCTVSVTRLSQNEVSSLSRTAKSVDLELFYDSDSADSFIIDIREEEWISETKKTSEIISFETNCPILNEKGNDNSLNDEMGKTNKASINENNHDPKVPNHSISDLDKEMIEGNDNDLSHKLINDIKIIYGNVNNNQPSVNKTDFDKDITNIEDSNTETYLERIEYFKKVEFDNHAKLLESNSVLKKLDDVLSDASKKSIDEITSNTQNSVTSAKNYLETHLPNNHNGQKQQNRTSGSTYKPKSKQNIALSKKKSRELQQIKILQEKIAKSIGANGNIKNSLKIPACHPNTTKIQATPGNNSHIPLNNDEQIKVSSLEKEETQSKECVMTKNDTCIQPIESCTTESSKKSAGNGHKLEDNKQRIPMSNSGLKKSSIVLRDSNKTTSSKSLCTTLGNNRMEVTCDEPVLNNKSNSGLKKSSVVLSDGNKTTSSKSLCTTLGNNRIEVTCDEPVLNNKSNSGFKKSSVVLRDSNKTARSMSLCTTLGNNRMEVRCDEPVLNNKSNSGLKKSSVVLSDGNKTTSSKSLCTTLGNNRIEVTCDEPVLNNKSNSGLKKSSVVLSDSNKTTSSKSLCTALGNNRIEVTCDEPVLNNKSNSGLKKSSVVLSDGNKTTSSKSLCTTLGNNRMEVTCDEPVLNNNNEVKNKGLVTTVLNACALEQSKPNRTSTDFKIHLKQYAAQAKLIDETLTAKKRCAEQPIEELRGTSKLKKTSSLSKAETTVNVITNVHEQFQKTTNPASSSSTSISDINTPSLNIDVTKEKRSNLKLYPSPSKYLDKTTKDLKSRKYSVETSKKQTLTDLKMHCKKRRYSCDVIITTRKTSVHNSTTTGINQNNLITVNATVQPSSQANVASDRIMREASSTINSGSIETNSTTIENAIVSCIIPESTPQIRSNASQDNTIQSTEACENQPLKNTSSSYHGLSPEPLRMAVDLIIEYFYKSSGNSTATTLMSTTEMHNDIIQFVYSGCKTSKDISIFEFISSFLSIYTHCFINPVCTVINKLAEILHLYIADFNSFNESTGKAKAFISKSSAIEEDKRANQEHHEMLSLRGHKFGESFLKLMSNIKCYQYTMTATAYFRIIQALFKIDIDNAKYISYLPKLCRDLIKSSKCNLPDVIKFFDQSDNIINETYMFVKRCLVSLHSLGYDKSNTQDVLLFTHLSPSSIILSQLNKCALTLAKNELFKSKDLTLNRSLQQAIAQPQKKPDVAIATNSNQIGNIINQQNRVSTNQQQNIASSNLGSRLSYNKPHQLTINNNQQSSRNQQNRVSTNQQPNISSSNFGSRLSYNKPHQLPINNNQQSSRNQQNRVSTNQQPNISSSKLSSTLSYNKPHQLTINNNQQSSRNSIHANEHRNTEEQNIVQSAQACGYQQPLLITSPYQLQNQQSIEHNNSRRMLHHHNHNPQNHPHLQPINNQARQQGPIRVEQTPYQHQWNRPNFPVIVNSSTGVQCLPHQPGVTQMIRPNQWTQNVQHPFNNIDPIFQGRPSINPPTYAEAIQQIRSHGPSPYVRPQQHLRNMMPPNAQHPWECMRPQQPMNSIANAPQIITETNCNESIIRPTCQRQYCSNPANVFFGSCEKRLYCSPYCMNWDWFSGHGTNCFNG